MSNSEGDFNDEDYLNGIMEVDPTAVEYNVELTEELDEEDQPAEPTVEISNNTPPPSTSTKKHFDIIRRTTFREGPPDRHIFQRRTVPYANRWYVGNNMTLNSFSPTTEGTGTLKFKLEPDNVVCIYNARSIYSPVYPVKKLVFNGISFRSVDEGYQYYKLLHLCNKTYQFRYRGTSRTFIQRNYVRRCLAQHKKTRDDVIRWRQERGLKILYDLTLQKFIQNLELFKVMKRDKDKLILNIHREDNYDACGRVQDLQDWLQDNIDKVVRIPIINDFGNLQRLPKISTGRNIQGVIVMLVRQYLIENGWY
uniref:NADAR domain-containing protein n=1 Tax=Strongyloides papillosus TaxID=174720 RepID=A0A0N5BQE8_STREA